MGGLYLFCTAPAPLNNNNIKWNCGGSGRGYEEALTSCCCWWVLACIACISC